jgi:hypothetical protein
MATSNRGARGVPARMLPGSTSYLAVPNLDLPTAGGAWAPAQSFTASGVFTAPSSGVRLNKRGKVEVFLTACAAGGAGGGDAGAYAGLSAAGWRFPNGGQGGDWVFRYKVELNPGEQVAVTIPGAAVLSNGGSLTFGSYLALSGGVRGTGVTAGPSTPNPDQAVSGAILSGSIENDNAIREGSTGGRGGQNDSWSNQAHSHSAEPGKICPAAGAFAGGAPTQGSVNISSWSCGGGGAGLFGPGGAAQTGIVSGNAGTAGGNNTGAGGGGGDPGGAGGSGRLDVTWRIAA